MADYRQIHVPRGLWRDLVRAAETDGVKVCASNSRALEVARPADFDRYAEVPSGPVRITVMAESWRYWEGLGGTVALARKCLRRWARGPRRLTSRSGRCVCAQRRLQPEQRAWKIVPINDPHELADCQVEAARLHDEEGWPLRSIAHRQGLADRSSALRRVRAGRRLLEGNPTRVTRTRYRFQCDNCGAVWESFEDVV